LQCDVEMLRQLLKARGRKDGESVMRERGRCWEKNYDEVREINDKSHSEREREREKKGEQNEIVTVRASYKLEQ